MAAKHDHETRQAARRAPRVLWLALVSIVLIETLIAVRSEVFMDDTALMYREKLRWAAQPQTAEVFVFGDSSAVASVRPSQIETFLPEGTGVLNLGMTATGPTGAEILLRRHLESHEPPTLAVLSFSPRSLTDDPPEFFVTYALTHLLGSSDLGRLVARTSRPSYLLSWGLSRLPSFRYREDLRTGFLSLVLDRLPALQPIHFESLGWGDNEINRLRFQWRYTRRAQRNRELLGSLREESGWHYFREFAMPTERLPDGLPLHSPPFEATPREAGALAGLLDLCRAHGVAVLVVPSVRPAMRMAAIRAEGGGERFDAFWQHVFRRYPEVHHTNRQAVGWPHRFFADGAHVNPEGAERYGNHIGPIIARTWSRLPSTPP